MARMIASPPLSIHDEFRLGEVASVSDIIEQFGRI